MRRLHLNAMIYGMGIHVASWRMPTSDPLAVTRLSYWCDLATQIEQGGFDALFLGDILALQHEATYQVAGSLDPLMILSALAGVTKKIGLIGTASTTFDHPYHIARRLASLDHISEGRAGWNIVTSSKLSEAKNFGRDVLAPHEERYARARDCVHAVMALWNSWKPDARIADKTSGLYLAPDAVKNTNYTGTYIRSIGPLNVPPPPQGRPLLANGGVSHVGRDFSSAYADLSLTVQNYLEDAQAFYNDIKTRASNNGRPDGSIVVLPGVVPIIGKDYDDALARIRKLYDMALPHFALQQLSDVLEYDLTQMDIHAPLPTALLDLTDDITQPNRARLLLNYARRTNSTLIELTARFLCGRGHLLAIGSPKDIADTMQQWFENGAADGFNVLFPVLPADLVTFSAEVIPILEERGLRTRPEAPQMLRQRYNLPMAAQTIPANPQNQIYEQLSNTNN